VRRTTTCRMGKFVVLAMESLAFGAGISPEFFPVGVLRLRRSCFRSSWFHRARVNLPTRRCLSRCPLDAVKNVSLCNGLIRGADQPSRLASAKSRAPAQPSPNARATGGHSACGSSPLACPRAWRQLQSSRRPELAKSRAKSRHARRRSSPRHLSE
jgi:hypothetical protein